MTSASVLARVEAQVRASGARNAVVAFSGGVDSSVVLAVTARVLGPGGVSAVTAVSPSYPAGELELAGSVARGLGVRHRVIRTTEVSKEAYARNDETRCFHCKVELYAAIRRLLAEASRRDAMVFAGANADDTADFRPGLGAARLHGVLNPLLDARVGKTDVRQLARELGLTVADKPALACLSSRVALGIRITPELLERIDRAEQAVRALGFPSVRVRHFGDVAKIEVPIEAIAALVAEPRLPELVAEIRSLGWSHVTLDLEGARSGSMNLVRTLPVLG